MTNPTTATDRIRDAAMRLFAEHGARDISISDLAQAAGVARGTIYNNLPRPEALFDDVVADLACEMFARVSASMAGLDDPARRVATGLRMFLARAHAEPHWGRFILRFAASDDTLRRMMDDAPAQDIAAGIAAGRFAIDPDQTGAAVGLLTGACLVSIQAVLSGYQTWRDAGSNSAELALRAFGLSPAEARAIAREDLPALAPPSAMRAMAEPRETRS